jgi:Leu/Phe-tRNA-protein transferase
MEENYYWSDDFSNEFYIKAAQCGFIITSMCKNGDFFLLPEIQFDYAIMDFDNIKVPKKVSKLIKKENYTFTINQKFDEVLENIKKQHIDSWMKEEYIIILKNIKKNNHLYENFELISVELNEKVTNELIAGEIGYKTNNIYTSLSGFMLKQKKYNNWGKLQLILLNKYLQKNSYNFWNLGHPQLQYKLHLGSRIYNRKDFLNRWNSKK